MARARLGMAFQDLRGEFDGQVLARTKVGLVTKGRPKYKYPKNPNVQEGVGRLKLATAVWNTFTAPQAEAWRNYAETLVRRDEVTGVEYSPTGKNAYIGLATKFQQASPGEPIPVVPPATAFEGEDWILGVAVVPGGVRFTAPGPNSPGTTTELLVQPLLNVRRSPGRFYKSAAFHTYEGGLTFDLTLSPGAYALAFRFVRLASGQATELRKLKVINVV